MAARLYDPTAGRVLLGGTDLRDLRLEDVRSAVSIVTQRPILFSVSLRENLVDRPPRRTWDEVLARLPRRPAWRRSSTTCRTATTR